MKLFSFLCVLINLIFCPLVFADEGSVDKVYHPYVLPNEREVEWRFASRQNDDGNLLTQRFAFGTAVSEYMTLEFYLVAARDENDDFGLASYEVEARWMLTEQGQYWADWGALFEIEKAHDRDLWEATSGILIEKEFGSTSLTTNFLLSYVWGNDRGIDTESEVIPQFRLKYRYRWHPWLQPSVEIYTGENFVGIGPAFMGIQRYQGQKQLKWELGFISGFNGDSKDHTLRFVLEYEF
ncbi:MULTISPECIES: hypothetical protein [Alteromonadaceae]|uniref:hypothetical protein n=1 Tax=Alteromonadaceae TaxID=72275 RepID=UPI001C080BF6|nr:MULTISPECIES: hypothetical protein [Aliiglaciecola]MBU2877568.1 hypothetical protein [Aliiglaciecola lipolytica]MDO6711148.1 hypothetical protein [Aliiglaciecola sp. 2_MG-2023]MDO6752062.1 hypothetical protein [Aliiglaciecola sp. 1_MG-2023]